MDGPLRSTSFYDDPLVAQLLQHVKVDDVLALAVICLASLAYVTKSTLWSRPDPYRYKLFERLQLSDDATRPQLQSRDIATRMQQVQADVAVLWASQSGTAERFASRLVKDLTSLLGVRPILLDISDIEPASYEHLSPNNVVIFLASTFGEGDPSDNMHEFWAWLHSTSDSSLLNMRFAAFGLGNSKYKHYNRVVDVLAEELQRRGAEPLMIGKADDAVSQTEEHFYDWKEKLLQMFEEKFDYQRRELSYEPTFSIVEDHSVAQTSLHRGEPLKKGGFHSSSRCHQLPVTQAFELLDKPGDRSCLHLEFDITQAPELKYKTGDYLAVWPVNPTSEVDMLLQALGLDARRETPLLISPLDGTPSKIPSPATVDTLFRSYLEVCAPVPRECVKTLASYAPTTHAKEFLEHVSVDNAHFTEFAVGTYVNIGRLLHAACDIPGAWGRVPLSLMIEMLPAMRPRYYSISSSSMLNPRRIAITVIVSDKISPRTGTRIPGLATNYLLFAKDSSHPRGLTYGQPSTLQTALNAPIHIGIRKSTFKLPTSAATPVIMVGAGTGVAPFRAFVQERARLKSIGREVGSTKLFFGCRSSDEDFIYASEFNECATALGDCFSLHAAFSRPNESSKRQYVQDVVEEQAECLAELLLEQNAYLYVCGSAAMARGVSDAVKNIIIARRMWSDTEFKEYADRQRRQRRWLQDVWA